MALFRDAAQPLWQAEHLRFTSNAERNLRDLSHLSLLVFAAAAVTTGILAGISLSANFGMGLSLSFIVVVILFPLLCGLLVREVWYAKKLEGQIQGQESRLGKMGSILKCCDNVPAGFLIVSHDMRVQFANQQYLDSTLQEPEEVLGREVEDVLPAEALAGEAEGLLKRSDPAASCCFDTFLRAGLAGEQPVHITMTRIASRHGESRILVVVEDIHPDTPAPIGGPLRGYVC
jgi:PAS domain-containing protein